MDNPRKMTQEEHEDLCVYLETVCEHGMKKFWTYRRFMANNYLKTINDTLSELLTIDAEEAGL